MLETPAKVFFEFAKVTFFFAKISRKLDIAKVYVYIYIYTSVTIAPALTAFWNILDANCPWSKLNSSSWSSAGHEHGVSCEGHRDVSGFAWPLCQVNSSVSQNRHVTSVSCAHDISTVCKCVFNSVFTIMYKCVLYVCCMFEEHVWQNKRSRTLPRRIESSRVGARRFGCFFYGSNPSAESSTVLRDQKRSKETSKTHGKQNKHEHIDKTHGKRTHWQNKTLLYSEGDVKTRCW